MRWRRGTHGSPISDSDITCKAFAALLNTRADDYPISTRYMLEVHDSPDKTGSSEREHMVGWWQSQSITGNGPYSRKTPNQSSRRCYAYLSNAASILWIAEAVGVPAEQIELAYAAAEGAYQRTRNVRSASSAAKRVLPWKDIFERARALIE